MGVNQKHQRNFETFTRECGHVETTWEWTDVKQRTQVSYKTTCTPACWTWGGVRPAGCPCGCGWASEVGEVWVSRTGD